MTTKDLIKINDYLWEIPKSFRNDMKVPARIYTSQSMLEDIFRDDSIQQLINGTTLPGIYKYAVAMPDMHQGYSVPIGFVGAIKTSNGVISPGACGFDINCGMRVLKSERSIQDIMSSLEKLALEIQRQVPSGLGRGRKIKLSINQIDKILEKGTHVLLEQGYGEKQDAENAEANGRLKWANSKNVSLRAKERGRDQVGTLGSGNHFLEIQKVQEIFNEKIAKDFGLFKNQAVVMIHTGSRGLGHQVCSDYLKEMIPAMAKHNIKVPDKEFACVPFKSPEGQRYFSAMASAANYAWANRHMIGHYVRIAWKNILGNKEKLKMLYDVAHNIIKKEKYDGIETIVHRKGATRAFPNQPVLIPGSMGTASYILSGKKEAEQSFFSVSHGAGRTMSRHQARRTITGKEVINQLKQKGIILKCRSQRGIAEEAPLAYKNIDNVVNVISAAGLADKVVRLEPLAVIKGE
ncbi:tRNA-splicing ligase [Parcubacteria bacterium DG_72]|nr:MAG: tRNA-splicing ligase [Parcubacteria bacterium DG_72]